MNIFVGKLKYYCGEKFKEGVKNNSEKSFEKKVNGKIKMLIIFLV